MTFIDVSQGRPSTSLIVGYAVLCVISVLCAYWAVNLGRSRLHYRSFFSVRVLFPIALCILALENAALAATRRLYDNIMAAGGDENYGSNLFIRAVFILQTFEVPILLIVIFEITYLVHKRRSVNFCGMYFDQGVRVNNTAFMSCMLRNSIRTLATVLLVMGLLVNFDLFHEDAPVDELAGRAGWWALSGEQWEGKVHLLLSLIPTAILVLVSFYLSIMLWRYGTESAMVVHSSMCNPWFYSFFGTLALAASQLFGEELYTIMSNIGLLIFTITILLLMVEVDKDIIATNDVACFLVQVAQKGDQIRVVQSASPTLQPHHDPPFRSEEKPRDEESGQTYTRANDRKVEAEANTPTNKGTEASRTSGRDNQTENIEKVGELHNKNVSAQSAAEKEVVEAANGEFNGVEISLKESVEATDREGADGGNQEGIKSPRTMAYEEFLEYLRTPSPDASENKKRLE
ncbi:hypothetical protein ACHAWF_006747 [Thalassiosira exigua]